MVGEPQPAIRNASREASEWFVFLQDDPDDVDLRRRFEEWLAASPEHAAAWSVTLRASSLAESLLPFDARDWVGAAAKAPGAPTSRMRDRDASTATAAPTSGCSTTSPPMPPRKRRRLFPFLVSAAAACLLFVVAPAAILQFQSDYSTSIGQVQDVELQDGSIVTLAPGSAIAVSYTGTERQVRLLSGEAFFSVKPNAERPFRVTARTVRASVLGTSFDVRLGTQDVNVSVTEGKVQVESAGIAEMLVGGQAIRLASADGTAHRSTLAPHAIGAWRQGQLIMEDQPLRAAVEQLDRYFEGTIILAQGALADRPVTGIFDLRDPEGSLRAMAKALDAKVRKVTPWILILSTP